MHTDIMNSKNFSEWSMLEIGIFRSEKNGNLDTSFPKYAKAQDFLGLVQAEISRVTQFGRVNTRGLALGGFDFSLIHY